MKNKTLNLLIIFLLLLGTTLIVFPYFANLYNQEHNSSVITNYVEKIEQYNKEETNDLIESAKEYNERLRNTNLKTIKLPDDLASEYKKQLNIDSDGIMGYLEIDKIELKLPIYHYSDNNSLSMGVGHVEYTSLPIGGKSSHAVLAGHSGLRTKTYFNGLFDLEIGDRFVISILDDKLTYQIDNISEVLPNDLNNTKIIEGEDYCTLLTCSPIGVNSHRLLVRGKRVLDTTTNPQIIIKNEAKIIDSRYVGLAYSAIIYLLFMLFDLLKWRVKRK